MKCDYCEKKYKDSESYSNNMCIYCYEKQNKTKKKISLIVISIVSVIIILLISVKPILKSVYEMTLMSDLKRELSNFKYDSLEFEYIDYYDTLIVKSESFSILDFDEKTKYISDITKIYEKSYKAYYDKLKQIDEDNFGKTKLIVESCGKSYKYSEPNLWIDDKTKISISDNLIEKIIKRLNTSTNNEKEEYVKFVKNTPFTQEELEQINSVEDKDLINEINYRYGIKMYNNGNFDKALEYFEKTENYADTKTYYEQTKMMKTLQGSWISQKFYDTDRFLFSYKDYIVIDGWKVYWRYNTASEEAKVKEYESCIEDNKLILNSSVSLKLNDKKVTMIHESKDYNNRVFTKDSISTAKPKAISKPVPPRIGMTADEVRNSTWGSPKEINKNTYSWGTTEQWVYYGYKYIYFRNGVVSSISE